MDAMIRGSVGEIARMHYGNSIARAWLNVELIALVDVSASMRDLVDGRAAIDWAQRALEQLQVAHPGRVAIIAYNDRAGLHIDGRLPMPTGGTRLAPALRLAQQIAAPDVKLVVISDGLWQDHAEAMQVARAMVNPIDGIYVGDDAAGLRALQEICRSGATMHRRPPELPAAVRGLLTGE